MRTLLLLLMVGLLSGCATASPAVIESKRAAFEASVPTCEGEADCKAKWEAAQLWVVHNAGWKIQTATEVLIETYNPPRGDTRIAARVTKEPLGQGPVPAAGLRVVRERLHLFCGPVGRRPGIQPVDRRDGFLN